MFAAGSPSEKLFGLVLFFLCALICACKDKLMLFWYNNQIISWMLFLLTDDLIREKKQIGNLWYEDQ